MLKHIDKQRLLDLHSYVTQCVNEGIPLSIESLIELKNIESQLALCLKVLQSYKVKPPILSASNCDIWWNIMVCNCNDFNVGSAYGYKAGQSLKVCEGISKYIIWFLTHLDKELFTCHDNLVTISLLISKGIYSLKDVTNTFKKTRKAENLLFIPIEEWKLLLLKSRTMPFVNVDAEIHRKFKKKNPNNKSMKELVYS